MQYLVEFAERAIRDLEFLYRENNAAESIAAARWYNGLEKAVQTLGANPRRCAVAPESRTLGRKLRHLLYGRKPHTYRVIYELDESRRVVLVLTIRHGARRRVAVADLG